RARSSRDTAARARSRSLRGARSSRAPCGGGTGASAARGGRAGGASAPTTSPRPRRRAAASDDRLPGGLSCRAPLLHARCELGLEQSVLVDLPVDAAAVEQLVVRAPGGHATV